MCKNINQHSGFDIFYTSFTIMIEKAMHYSIIPIICFTVYRITLLASSEFKYCIYSNWLLARLSA